MRGGTRLLLLGVLRNRPLHGYEVRQTLETWGAARWANLAYGSIYFGLRKLADEGLLEVVATERGKRGPARTVYRLTDSGRLAFEHLLREAWWEARPSVDAFQTALTFMDCLPREELLAVLRRRAHLLRSELEGLAFAADVKLTAPGTPRHIAENLNLMRLVAEASLRWSDDVIQKVEHGDLP